MKKIYLLSLVLFLLFSDTAFAQMQRVIRNHNGSLAQPIVIPPANNFANAVASCSVDTITLTTQAQINNFAANYPTCTTPKYLIINGLGASPAITSLAGLGTITQVINKLKITNTSITSLAQLTGLTEIGDTLELEKNNLLSSIGLNNLTTLGSIYFKNLPALTSIAGLSNNITAMNNVRLDSTLALVNISGLSNITHLDGNLEVGYTAVTSLSALNNCNYIAGWMWINNNDNLTAIGLTNLTHCSYFLLSDMPLLTSLAGLTNNITNTNTGTFWVINTGVATLNGLDSLTSAPNFYINGNINLTSIAGLQNLSGDIGGGFSFFGNPLLTSLAPLSGITSVSGDGTIEVEYNNLITDLNGLQNIVNIGKGLRIIGNGNLTTLNALNNNLIIQNNPDSYNNQKDSVEIYDNNQLSLCSDTSLCNYFANGGTADIHNNAAGCNDIAEIEANCTVFAINYNDVEDNCCNYNAIPVVQGQVKNGNVGHYVGLDGNGDPYNDDYDTYRIIMPYSGAFKLFVTAKNDSSCYENTNSYFDVDILDESGNSVQYQNFFNWASNDACNVVKTDSFKFRGYAADTFYLRLSGDKVSYSFYWQALDSTADDEGDNDDITTSFYISPLQIKKGSLKFKTANHDDQHDDYKTVLPVSANIDVYLKITSRENQFQPPNNRFHFQWGYTAPYGYFSNSNYVLLPPADSIIYDTLHICALANDTMYFRLTAPVEAYEYEWSFKIIDTIPNDAFEPNNSFVTAAPFAVSQTKISTIGYVGKNAKDNEDDFVTVLPQNGIMKIFVQATSNKCDAGYLNFAGLNRQKNYVFTKYISGSTSIPTQTTVYDTILICGQPADTFYFKFLSSAAFNYQFRYEMIDPIPNAPEDVEPNNSFATAVPFNELDSMNGRLRFITTPSIDETDYYRTILPKDGAMNIILKTTNYNCGSAYVSFWAYDRRKASGNFYFNQFSSQSGLTRYDTIKLCGLASDTFYFQIQSFSKFVYSLKYQLLDTSINDVEPNNNFVQAVAYNENDIKKGHLGYRIDGNTDYDYYRTILPKDGTMKLIVQATNKSCADNAYLYAHFYDRRKEFGDLYQKYIAYGISAGATAYDTIVFCGRAADTFYVRYEASTAFNYQFKYQMVDTSANDVEPNGSFAQATPINILENKYGHIRYNANGGTDTYDFYKTKLPTDGTLKIISQVTNTNCANGQYVYLRVYDKLQNQLLGKYVGSSSVAAGQTVFDTAFICGTASDSIYFLIEATNSFAYQLKYDVIDTSENDAEPNNNFAQALNINILETKKGHIHYNVNGSTDTYDYYKTKLPTDGTLKIMSQVTNTNCANGQYVYLRVFDKLQNQLLEKYVGSSSVAAGQTVYDTALICGRASDSIYYRFEATNSFAYQFKYDVVDTSMNDAEPNGTFAQATLFGGSQTKKGHIRYTGAGGTDIFDYYKIVFDNSDSLKLQLQATNTNCSNGQYVYLRVYDKNYNQLLEKYLGSSSVPAGTTVTDNINLLVNAPDTIYIRFEATNAFQYQFTTNQILPTGSFSIDGETSVCFGVKTYKAVNVVDGNVVYHWSLPNGGGTITAVDSIATVNWTTNGNRQVQLYLSNIIGNSAIKTINVIVNNNAPTAVPVIINANRNLFTNNVPAGAYCQWYKNGVIIPGATDSTYYAADAGSFTAKFVNPCGAAGGASNPITFAAAAIVQTITFTHTPNITMSLTAKAKLNASASSGLPVNFVLVSGNGTVIQDTVYANSVGTIIVRAQQNGDNVYSPAIFKYDTITVVPGTQTITFPAIADTVFTANPIVLTATSSVGLPITYSVVSGNATISGNNIILTSAGNITVQANQAGNADYASAPVVQRTFCVGVRSLSAIQGQINPCLNAYVYTAQKIPGANYLWTLSSGGILTTNQDTAFITWTAQGTHTITVKANSNCNPAYSSISSYTIITANNPPVAVTNMLPVNNAVNQQLPLNLSWQPGLYSVNYDLYVWDSTLTQPATPFAANIGTVNFTLPQNSLAYNKAYKWRIFSKNPCQFTVGPIQQFRLVPLPDLAVTQVLAPATAFSGQSITISWSVKNNGPGRTQTNQTWSDAVYLSFDTIPNFNVPPETNPGGWSQLQFPIRPLLIGTKPNVSALDSGMIYTNSLNFTLPVNYSQPIYAYVITNKPANPNLPQITNANDTARAPLPINVTLSPTPDLRVDTVFTPASTFSGSTVNVTYKVKNYGVVTPPNVTWYDKFYISPTAVFNASNATELLPPGANGRYYNCNNYYPGVLHATQLNADSSYTNSVPLVMPNFILGTYFIHVITNRTATLYEGALANNNTNSNQIQIYLTPTPVLDVANLTLQSNSVSTTQNVGINWNINNSGFYDNIENSQGHYAKQGAFCGNFLVGYTNPGNQPILAAGYSYTDSLGWGSSYWNDKIYLSRDSGNIATANLIYLSKLNHGVENNVAPCNDYNNTCLIGGNYDRNIFNIIRPTLNYPSSSFINIPDTLSVGNYYVYVLANADKTVYEYPAINRYKRSGVITVNRPDLTPPIASVQPNTTAGVPVNINYTISNGGLGNVYNHARRDKYYVSTAPIFTGAAVQIGTQTFTENVLAGSSVSHSFTYTFPPGTPTSTRYFYVVTNYDSLFKETNMANNLSAAAATNVTIAVAKDLIVTNVQLPVAIVDTVFTLTSWPLKYTVKNNGVDSIVGKQWVDSVFVSCTSAFNSNTAFFLARRTHNNILAAGENYADSFNINIPKFSYQLNACFGSDNTNAYFVVRTNADTGVYEGANMANNYTSSIQKKLINPYIDLIVTSVGGADTATVARNYTTNWAIKNIKYYTIYGYDQYNDGIYFSPDSVFNANAIAVGNKSDDRKLASGQALVATQTYILPNIPTGDYYVHVKTNVSGNLTAENNVSNNTNLIRNGLGAAKKIHVNTTPLPDVTDSIIAAPPTLLAVGQSYNIKYKIKNEGAGVTYPSNMNTVLYLSTTTQAGGIVLQQVQNYNPLQAGSFYTDSVTFNIPINTVPGNYVIVVNADNNSNIIESNETNNIAYKFVTVYSPAPSDLIVQNVAHPDSVYLGYTIDSLKWIVKNTSANAAQGISSDGLYLTSSALFDSTATLIGIKNKTINMLPLASDTLVAQPLVNNVTEGSYKVFVKTDFLNNIVETDKDNNVGTPVGNIYVRVKELPLNVLTPNTLAAIPRYYKLVIPNSLNGSTILVTLKSNDSLTSTNQMYIGKGFIPSAAHFDYQYDKPNYGNQDIVITSVTPGDYYITTSKITSTVVTQTISLKAVKLPFAILNVQSNSGGNTGNVTVKISGSLFSNNMVATLTKNSTIITASAVYFVNTTSVYATFNLAGKPLGIYDVSLTKPDTTVALLANSFSIVPANNGGLITGGGINGIPGNGNDVGCDPNAPSGLNAQLVSELVLPPKVFGGWPFVIQINYSNPTNIDIAAQTRILYCLDGFPIALSAAGLATAGSSIYLELSEPGGPPGIIRAGGSGTITLYSKAPVTFPAHQFGNYILK